MGSLSYRVDIENFLLLLSREAKTIFRTHSFYHKYIHNWLLGLLRAKIADFLQQGLNSKTVIFYSRVITLFIHPHVLLKEYIRKDEVIFEWMYQKLELDQSSWKITVFVLCRCSNKRAIYIYLCIYVAVKTRF